jgi:hypothetical protein
LSFFSVIGHFFSSLFGTNGGLAQKVLHEAGSFVNMAQPIIEEIETEIKSLPDQGKSIQSIEAFLAKYDSDAVKVAGIATSLAGLPASGPYGKTLAVTASVRA